MSAWTSLSDPSRRASTPLRRLGGLAAVALLASACGGASEEPAETPHTASPTAAPPTAAASPAPLPPGPYFLDRAAEVGLDFVHSNGMQGEYWFAEMTGAGGGFLDYDRDGDLDVYLVQGGPLAPGLGTPERDRLFRNELAESGELRFTDVTEAAGLVATGYGMGVAVGDFTNDGYPDLYLTNFGPNQMWVNRGDGTFEEVSARAGTGDDRWSTAAAFLDYDQDGWLDLFVGNYVDFTLENHKQCYAASSALDYCGPLSYQPYPDRLFHNRGDGTFEDVSAYSQIASEYGAALGVVAADFNGDGRTDLYVANDGTANLLWLNQGNGRFRNEALLAGAAYNAAGKAEGSMGVDAADFDSDGDEDLFMTHITDETNTLYVNDGSAMFTDRSRESGLAAPSRARTGFGTAWFDLDNDGRLDLLVANGAVVTIPEQRAAGDPYPLHQPNQLFYNRGGGRFEEVTTQAGGVFELSEVSRGAAFGDVDNDGDADVLVANNRGPARLLINQIGQRASWLGVRLALPGSLRDAYGARAAVTLPDGRRIWRRVRTDASYCAANDPRLLFGLGDATGVRSLTVSWPDGRREEWDLTAEPVDHYLELIQGSGQEAR